ncbi:Uncharacterised protein [BD1-7 clade bacterium]|uniref:Uncharacterized protein n=1 Tax=BD1-7 clade bacterium TaxID=2029982 RepID=A0A5S9QST9_9GAMM|nr:Uncharacterised protein [BD1-7 clade bacterium]CAA0121347.1 Uncharacterised protein [BD1-7 clade bacterium]
MNSQIPDLHHAILGMLSTLAQQPQTIVKQIGAQQIDDVTYLDSDNSWHFTLEGLYQVFGLQHGSQFKTDELQNLDFNTFRQCLYKNPTNTLLSEIGLIVDIAEESPITSTHCYRLREI